MFKKISGHFIYVSLFLLLTNCSAVKTRSFDERIIYYGGFKVHSAHRPWSIERENKIVRAGKGSLKFELRPTDRWSSDSSFRCELSEKYQPSAKQDIWYGFSIYVPEQQGTKRQYITLAQFHDPGPCHKVRPPNLRIYLNNDEMFVTICWKSKKDISWLPKEYKRSISKDTGVTIANKGFKIKAFEFNKWLDFVINAKWSADNDGYINIWLNDEKTVQYSGPNLYGNYLTPYFKFGIYLSAGANRHIITYFDEYRRGKSYNEVNPVQTSE